MTIEVRRPELEALIQEWMKSGAFQDVEDALIQALKSSPLRVKEISGRKDERLPATGAELVAAMQLSPCKEISLELGSERAPVRDVTF
jgi:hypothetical protein